MPIQVISGSGQPLLKEGKPVPMGDGMVLSPSRLGVIDADGAAYSPDIGRERFMDGRFVDEEMVRLIIERAFDPWHSAGLTLEQILLVANEEVRNFQHGREHLAGASFAFAELRNGKFVIVTGGDSHAWWLYKDGRAGMTPNRVYPYEARRLRIFDKYLKQAGNDKTEAWNLYRPWYAKHRDKVEGKKFASVNGLDDLPKLWDRREIPANKLAALLLFTDGFVHHASTRNSKKLVATLAKAYKKAGILGMLQAKRKAEGRKLATSHSEFLVEATCIEVTAPFEV